MPSQIHAKLSALTAAHRAAAAEPVTLDEQRAGSGMLAAMLPPTPGVSEEPVAELPGSLLFSPSEPRDDVVTLLIHGGAFRFGSPLGVRMLAGQLALRTGARVLCPEYRLAPENPYPAALDDCERDYEHLATLVPGACVAVVGESAGANLAAALLLRRRDAQDANAMAGVLFSGVFDQRPQRFTTGSWVDNAATDAVLGGGAFGEDAHSGYTGSRQPDDPGISPLLADLAGLPPLLLFASSTEMLLDDTVQFAVKAGRAGVETVLELWPGMNHSWPTMAGFVPEATEAAARAAAFILRVAEGHVVDGSALVDDPEILKMLP